MGMTNEELRERNARLVAQVKQFSRMEQRLFASRRRIETQTHRIAALNEFALSAPRCRSDVEIFQRLLDLACAHLSTQAVLLVFSRPSGDEKPTVLLRTADDPTREVEIPVDCRAVLREPAVLDQVLILPAVDPTSSYAPLFSSLERIAPSSDWERSTLWRTHLVLPIGSEPRPEGRRAVLVARCAVGSFRDDLIDETDQTFLQLLGRHTASAIEIVELQADLEQRVERRTRELASANQRQRESLASLDEAQMQLLQRMSELIRTREQLVQAEKAALAGRLAAAVAHEVNNPLAFMKTNLGLLSDQAAQTRRLWTAASTAAASLASAAGPEASAAARALKEALGSADELRWIVDELPEIVAETQEGARRIAELVRGLSALAGREGQPSPEAVDVGEAVAQAVVGVSEADRRGMIVELPPNPGVLAWISREDLRVSLLSLVRFLCGPKLRSAHASGATTIRVQEDAGGPYIALTAEHVHLSEEERRQLFDPRVEAAETMRGVRDRFSVELVLIYQMLLRNRAELSANDGPVGLTLRIVLQRPPEGSHCALHGAGDPGSK